MSTRTITLPTDQWEAILEAVQDRWDEGPPSEGWQSSRLSAASAALSTALAQSEPQGQQGLIDEDLTEFAEEWWRSFQYLEAGAEAATPIIDIVHSWHFVDFSHALLARWGRPAIEPVPVSDHHLETPND